jgi:hypothetical protein
MSYLEFIAMGLFQLTFFLFLLQCRVDTSFLASFIGVNLFCEFSMTIFFSLYLLAFLPYTSRSVENAEVVCLGIVSVAVFMLVLPLFKATGNILLQIAPGNVPPSAFMKCCRQVNIVWVWVHLK